MEIIGRSADTIIELHIQEYSSHDALSFFFLEFYIYSIADIRFCKEIGLFHWSKYGQSNICFHQYYIYSIL